MYKVIFLKTCLQAVTDHWYWPTHRWPPSRHWINGLEVKVTWSSAMSSFEWMYTSSLTGTPLKSGPSSLCRKKKLCPEISLPVACHKSASYRSQWSPSNFPPPEEKLNQHQHQHWKERKESWVSLIKTNLLLKTLDERMAPARDWLVLVMHNCPHAWPVTHFKYLSNSEHLLVLRYCNTCPRIAWHVPFKGRQQRHQNEHPKCLSSIVSLHKYCNGPKRYFPC